MVQFCTSVMLVAITLFALLNASLKIAEKDRKHVGGYFHMLSLYEYHVIVQLLVLRI
jgi:hypothetical protein